jgi:hypothetical protein
MDFVTIQVNKERFKKKIKKYFYEIKQSYKQCITRALLFPRSTRYPIDIQRSSLRYMISQGYPVDNPAERICLHLPLNELLELRFKSIKSELKQKIILK